MENNNLISQYGDDCGKSVLPNKHKRQLNHNNNNDDDDVDDPTTNKRNRKTITIDDIIDGCYGFFLNEIPDRPDNQLNGFHTISLKSILSNENGKIIESIHFNFLYNLEWLIDHYPANCRNSPIYIVFGNSPQSRIESCSYSNVKLCSIKLNGIYSCHHSKMIILHYEDDSIRIIILTANMTPLDWYTVTQGIWISPKLKKNNLKEDTSKTNFKNDLIQYLKAYEHKSIVMWINIIQEYDFSPINVFLIGSICNSHGNDDRESFGHLKIRKILRTSHYGPTNEIKNWPIICQFSSIGSLGKTPQSWLTAQFLASFSATYNDFNGIKPELKCIYPTIEDILNSLDKNGTCFPYIKSTADKQPYLNDFFYRWKASISDRNNVMPHIKTYARISPDNRKMAWFCLTSANLSKAAWGHLVKIGSKLRILNYELGVLFLPKLMINQDSFSISQNNPLFLPYDLPLVKYDPENDKPWINNNNINTFTK
ncbi:tyrosyl-DNA phosphodiesterase glaikit [Dermatophagoides farinae]|uniref:tyrosyl-DNA phosphodiesterase glaikit n=1 Tax=Dermatophagoides farinae TaxID=6954 RepID=UPI003F613AA2